MIDEKIFKKIDFNGAKGFIFIGENILVYRRDTNTKNYPLMLDLPGGGKEGDETPFETFTREVKEEFGIQVKRENVVYSKPHQSIIEPWKYSYFIIAKLPQDFENKIVFGDEGVEYLILTVKDYLRREDVIERHQVRLREYLESI
jgi:8-oxo-dGTP diphosphatase